MNERIKENNDEIEIDLRRVINALWQKIWLIILTAFIGAVLAFLTTLMFITPKYESAVMFYVNNSSVSLGDASFSISTGDISASKSLVDSYIVILKTRTTLTDVIDYAGVDRTYSEVKDMISASSVDSTEIFKVTVTSPDPKEANRIANSIAYILPKQISGIIEGTSAEIVDSAIVPSSPSSPSYSKNVAIGLIVGLFISIAYIALKEILDVTIRSEQDVEDVCKYPILATVPDMHSQSKGGYSYYSYRPKKETVLLENGKEPLFGDKISFAASEAYKMLRTKLQFSFADDKKCYLIGVSSALAGEGKSVTSINIAYGLAQLNKKILIIDGDLRKPTLHQKMNINKQPGLSNYLTRQVTVVDAIQFFSEKSTDTSFSMMAAGNTPPNPVELLSSARMEQMVDRLKEVYDYIIVDLPPIGEVSDALAISKLLDGIVLVVRENYCNRPMLSSAIKQFEFVETKILGVVINMSSELSKGYGKYKKYYSRYDKKAKKPKTLKSKFLRKKKK